MPRKKSPGAQWQRPFIKGRKEFEDAEGRVGATADKRVRWLINFAARWRDMRFDTPVPHIQVEALAFAKGYGKDSSQTGGPYVPLPEWKAVWNLGDIVNRWFQDLRDRHVIHIQAGAWAGRVARAGERLSGFLSPSSMTFEAAFALRAYNALVSLAGEHKRLRFCRECRLPFVVKREDSAMCSGSCRTKAWRKQNPEGFKTYRREYYRRKRGEQVGWTADKLKIQARRSP
jgi:hypothetical protein